MKVRDFTRLVLDNTLADNAIYVYEINTGTYIFDGVIEDLTEDILCAEIESWNIENGTLCLNISLERN